MRHQTSYETFIFLLLRYHNLQITVAATPQQITQNYLKVELLRFQRVSNISFSSRGSRKGLKSYKIWTGGKARLLSQGYRPTSGNCQHQNEPVTWVSSYNFSSLAVWCTTIYQALNFWHVFLSIADLFLQYCQNKYKGLSRNTLPTSLGISANHQGPRREQATAKDKEASDWPAKGWKRTKKSEAKLVRFVMLLVWQKDNI